MFESYDPTGRTDDGEFVEFVRAEATACGEFQCASCTYRAMIRRELPACPMCGGEVWERAFWAPFTSTPFSSLRSKLSG